MHRSLRLTLAALFALVLAALMGVAAGCALIGNTSVQHWEPVASGHVSGQRPTRLSLGTYRLGDRVRLAWVLSGPLQPPVRLVLRADRSTDPEGSYIDTLSMQKDPSALARRSEQGLGLSDVEPGEYSLYFSQLFHERQGPGYDIKFTVYTMTSLRR